MFPVVVCKASEGGVTATTLDFFFGIVLVELALTEVVFFWGIFSVFFVEARVALVDGGMLVRNVQQQAE